MAYGIRIRMEDGRYKDISNTELSPILLMDGWDGQRYGLMGEILGSALNTEPNLRLNLISYAMVRMKREGYPSRRNQFMSLSEAMQYMFKDSITIAPHFAYTVLARPPLNGTGAGGVGIRIDGRSVFNAGVDKAFIPSKVDYKRVMDLKSGLFDPAQISPELTPFNALYFFHSEDGSYVWPRIQNGYYLSSGDGTYAYKKGVDLMIETVGKPTGRFKVVVIKIRFAEMVDYLTEIEQYKYASEHGLEIGNRKAGLLLRDQWERVTYVSGVDVLYKIRTLNANTLASGGKMIPDIKHPMYSPSVVGFVGPYSHAIPLFIVNTANGSGVALKNNSYTLRDVLMPAFSGTSLVYGEEGELGGVCLTKDPLIVLDADDYFE